MPQINTINSPTSSFLTGGGEMGKLTREFNWSATTLGLPDFWPQSLLTTVNILLNSKFAMFLWWGPELIQFYNDAYRPGLGNPGKHPQALGQRGEDCWPEIWDTIQPLITGVLTTGKAVYHEDMLVPISRNGQLENSYWTFSYSKVNGDAGNIEGVFAVCTETTSKVITNHVQALNQKLIGTNNKLTETQKQLQQTIFELEKSESRLNCIIADAPVAVAILKSPELTIESANKKILEFWGKTDSIIGKPIHKALPELQGQQFLQLYQEVISSGDPYYGDEFKALFKRDNKLEEGYFNFVFQPLKNKDDVILGLMIVATEVTELVNARKKVERTEESLRMATEAAELGAFSINTANRVFVSSPSLKEFFGFLPDEEVSYEAVINQIQPNYREIVDRAAEDAITKGSRFDKEYPVIGYHNNKLRWLRGIGTLQYDNNGIDRYFTGVVHDITEKKLDEIRKNDFIGMVSHELKTPLTSLTAIIQVLNAKLKNNNDAFIAGALDRANIQAKKMSSMIDGFLHISRLESGKILIHKKSFNLDELIREIIDETALTISSHQITFHPCEPVTIFADRDKIASVISNLLNNAVKYSPNGKPIEFCCIKIGENVQISVKDEGFGIKPQDLDKLFDRYYRVESNNTKHISGFGIGLYLSAEIIRQHNGKIWAESENGKGSTFYFELPVQPKDSI